jgi:hypothetical protein
MRWVWVAVMITAAVVGLLLVARVGSADVIQGFRSTYEDIMAKIAQLESKQPDVNKGQMGVPNSEQPPPILQRLKDLTGSADGKFKMAPTQEGQTNPEQPNPISTPTK